MSWMMKLKLLMQSGMTRDEALVELITKLDADNRIMDIRLSRCIEYLTDEDIKVIFGDLKE
jgi:hypothetical protein